MRVILKLCTLFLLLIPFGFSLAADDQTKLSVLWNSGGERRELKTWYIEELSYWRAVSKRERDPWEGSMAQWDGVLLSSLLKVAMKDLSNEQRATVDLVILKDASGPKARIPREFINKYPVMVAIRRNSTDADKYTTPKSVVPWTSQPRLLQESLPVSNYFVQALQEVELTNYGDYYAQLYLKTRTNPTALRGEKLIVKTCMGCHTSDPRMGNGKGGVAHPSKWTAKWSGSGLDLAAHPKVQGLPDFTARDQRAVRAYFSVIRAEPATLASARK